MLHATKSFKSPNNQIHEITDFINCYTSYVIYGLTCPCEKIYVRCNIRPLGERFREHRLAIEKGLLQYTVVRHTLNKHNKDSHYTSLESRPPPTLFWMVKDSGNSAARTY